MSEKISLKVVGMSCQSCAQSITRRLADVPGVAHVAADHKTGRVDVTGEGAPLSVGLIESHLAALGFDSV